MMKDHEEFKRQLDRESMILLAILISPFVAILFAGIVLGAPR